MNSTNTNEKNINPLAVAVVGAVVGAAVVSLMDKDKRKKTATIVKKVRDNLMDVGDDIRSQTEEITQKINDKKTK